MVQRLLLGLSFALAPIAFAQGGGAPPPAKVTVAEAASGTLLQTSEWSGLVYFKEVASLATEVNGKVISVRFEEGDRIEQGTVLVELDHTLLDANLRAAKAAVAESRANLEQEQVRLGRAESLLKDEVTTQQAYDDIRFTVNSLAHRVDQLEAEADRIEEEIAKKTITAPFPGIVLERQSEIGEWKNNGDAIAVFARADVFDIMVPVPENNMPYVKEGAPAPVHVGGETLEGTIVTIIPKGDEATRTFPVKIRVEHKGDSLMEGMTALVDLPVGQTLNGIVVPRDAVLLERGEYAIYTIDQNKAKRVPVKVLGFSGLSASIEGPGLAAGSPVIVKGQERVKDGQPVEVI